MLSFRRLLHIENVLDMGSLTVRNAMRARRLVRFLSLEASREQNDAVIAEYRFSRYPVLGSDPEKPLGFVHVKDLLLADRAGKPTDDLRPFLRPCLTFREQDRLEQRLSEMQRKAAHMALVYAEDGRWSGIITLEDAIEEVIGTVEEEYPTEPTIRLADLLTPEHTLLDIEGTSIQGATRNALQRISVQDLPVSRDAIMLSIVDRERLGSSYVGRRLAIPHARLARLARPMVIVGTDEEAHPVARAGGGHQPACSSSSPRPIRRASTRFSCLTSRDFRKRLPGGSPGRRRHCRGAAQRHRHGGAGSAPGLEASRAAASGTSDRADPVRPARATFAQLRPAAQAVR